MRIKYKGEWYEVAMTQYDYMCGKTWYEVYDEPENDPEHTCWVSDPEDVFLEFEDKINNKNIIDFKLSNE